jgi:hypothetical protein
MRFTSLLVLALALAGAALAGSAARAETTTYIDGNLTGLTPQTGGTLLFSDDKAMYLRTGLATIPVPYANISTAELGGKQTHSHSVPVYKVWRKGKTETQLLIVNFKNEDGEDKSMTLELAPSAAASVVATINSHRGAAPTGVASAATAPATTADTTPAPAAPAATTQTAKSTKKSKREIAKQEKADKKKKSKIETAVVNPTPKPPADQWWGDDYWRTARNASKWDQASSDRAAGTVKTVAADKPAATDKPSQSQK